MASDARRSLAAAAASLSQHVIWTVLIRSYLRERVMSNFSWLLFRKSIIPSLLAVFPRSRFDATLVARLMRSGRLVKLPRASASRTALILRRGGLRTSGLFELIPSPGLRISAISESLVASGLRMDADNVRRDWSSMKGASNPDTSDGYLETSGTPRPEREYEDISAGLIALTPGASASEGEYGNLLSPELAVSEESRSSRVSPGVSGWASWTPGLGRAYETLAPGVITGLLSTEGPPRAMPVCLTCGIDSPLPDLFIVRKKGFPLLPILAWRTSPDSPSMLDVGVLKSSESVAVDAGEVTPRTSDSGRSEPQLGGMAMLEAKEFAFLVEASDSSGIGEI